MKPQLSPAAIDQNFGFIVSDRLTARIARRAMTRRNPHREGVR
jgi:hypothetical protein